MISGRHILFNFGLTAMCLALRCRMPTNDDPRCTATQLSLQPIPEIHKDWMKDDLFNILKLDMYQILF